MIDMRRDENPIFIGSPFFGYPSLDIEGNKRIKTNNLLILDLNVISFIRQRKNKTNIRQLLTWASLLDLEVTPIVGISEQYRSHANPGVAFKRYIQILREDYFYDLPEEEIERLTRVFTEYSPDIENNTGIFRDYLIVIKYFYQKKWVLEKKVEQFAIMVHKRNIPVLAFAFLLGCIYFYVKDNPRNFTQKIVSKVQSDMSISPNKEEKRLWNVASDIMLFMAPAELFYNYQANEYNFSYVASGDVTAGLILSELCYGQVVVNQNTCYGMAGFRPRGASSAVLVPLVQRYLQQSPQHSFTRAGNHDPRRNNLMELANELQES